jgi:hypothetical protein
MNKRCRGCPSMYFGTCTYGDAHVDCEIYREGMGIEDKEEEIKESKDEI